MSDQSRTTAESSVHAPYRLGLIGDPIAHSISPAMQMAGFAALGLNATYDLWPTPAADLAARMVNLRAPDVLGANVTVPHKSAVMALLDDITPLARRAGAVNTIVHQDSRLLGDNTDIHGFATALAEVCQNVSTRPTLVLGAGGAARAVILALEAMGVDRIAVANRTSDRIERLAADLAPTRIIPVKLDDPSLAAEVRAAGILINATTIGWHAGETPLPIALLSRLAPSAVVVDLTYRDTDLLLAARARGLRTLDGLAMLVHQGAKALELWTGQSAPVAAMFAAAEQAREARG